MRRLSSLLVLAAIALAAAGSAQASVHRHAAARVTATETEFKIKLSTSTVPAGKVRFLVHDAGKLAHQFLVIRTNRPASKLPLHGATVNLAKAGKLIGGFGGAGLAAGTRRAVALTLPRGRYVLICNLPGHYKAGQFTVLHVR